MTYLAKNWDGWPLHSIIAALLMHPYISNSYPLLMFAMNAVFWPCREAYQHHGFRNIWTLHRIIEWAAPIVVAFIMLMVMT